MRFATVAATMFLSLVIVDAQDGPPPPMGDDAPRVVLGPPEGFEPPDHPAMPEDPAEAHEMALDLFFDFMDADGSGEIDNGEFRAWVRRFHMPRPHDGDMHGEHGEPPHDGDMMHDDDGEMHPEGDHPEGDHSEGDHPEGDHPEGDHPEGDHPEGDHPEDDDEGGHPEDD